LGVALGVGYRRKRLALRFMGGVDNSKDFRRARSVVDAMHVHLVFVTQYRRHGLDSAGTDRCGRCSPSSVRTSALICGGATGEDDHVHLLVEYPPSVAIPKLVNRLQGVSSRRLRQQRPDIARRYWNGVLWSPSSFRGIVRRRSARYHPTVCGAAKEHGPNPALKGRACALQDWSWVMGARSPT
jgi:putative transposase